jgi:hypothetical protein
MVLKLFTNQVMWFSNILYININGLQIILKSLICGLVICYILILTVLKLF